MLFDWIGYSSYPSLAQPNLRTLARIEQVFTDSSASIGICHGTGLRIVRHLEIACSPRFGPQGSHNCSHVSWSFQSYYFDIHVLERGP